MRTTVRQMLTSVLLVQLVASIALALLAHTAIEGSGLLFQQTGLLRNGAIGALFHVVFLAATTILLFLDRVRAFAVLQGLFLVLNAGCTLAVTALVPDAFGLGYLIAAAISAIVAVLFLEDTTENIVSDTFAAAHRAVRNAQSRRPLSAALGSGFSRFARARANTLSSTNTRKGDSP